MAQGPGRPKGLQNRVTREFKEIARGILEQPEAIEKMKRAAALGRLHPSLHIAPMHYAYGKPKETVALEARMDPRQMTTADLVARMTATPSEYGGFGAQVSGRHRLSLIPPVPGRATLDLVIARRVHVLVDALCVDADRLHLGGDVVDLVPGRGL
jgi:hypothetical protein